MEMGERITFWLLTLEHLFGMMKTVNFVEIESGVTLAKGFNGSDNIDNVGESLSRNQASPILYDGCKATNRKTIYLILRDAIKALRSNCG